MSVYRRAPIQGEVRFGCEPVIGVNAVASRRTPTSATR